MSEAYCEARVHDTHGVGFRACNNRVKVWWDGRGYCGVHDPEAMKAKAELSHAKWERQYRIKVTAIDVREKKLKLHAELVTALQDAHKFLQQMIPYGVVKRMIRQQEKVLKQAGKIADQEKQGKKETR